MELLVETEKKTDSKYDQQFQELKSALEKLLVGRLNENQKAFDQKHQILLDLMGDLERKIDVKEQETLDSLRAEVGRLFDDRGQRFE